MSSSRNHSSIHAIHPWNRPEKPEGGAYDHQCDPQEFIDLCLKCPIPDGCHPKSRECALRGTQKNQRAEDNAALDATVLLAIRAWWSGRKIRSVLHIDYYKLVEIKERLRERGAIP